MKWHVDSGHGWLEVNRKSLEKLGVDKKISPYSYQKGTKVYLEEDCDASIYFEAYFKDSKWYEIEKFRISLRDIPRKLYKLDAPIRNYAPYLFNF